MNNNDEQSYEDHGSFDPLGLGKMVYFDTQTESYKLIPKDSKQPVKDVTIHIPGPLLDEARKNISLKTGLGVNDQLTYRSLVISLLLENIDDDMQAETIRSLLDQSGVLEKVADSNRNPIKNKTNRELLEYLADSADEQHDNINRLKKTQTSYFKTIRTILVGIGRGISWLLIDRISARNKKLPYPKSVKDMHKELEDDQVINSMDNLYDAGASESKRLITASNSVRRGAK